MRRQTRGHGIPLTRLLRLAVGEAAPAQNRMLLVLAAMLESAASVATRPLARVALVVYPLVKARITAERVLVFAGYADHVALILGQRDRMHSLFHVVISSVIT